MMNLRDGQVDTSDLKYLDPSPEEAMRYRLRPGDVLFNRTNSYELVGRTGVYQLDGEHLFASYLVRVVTDLSRLLPNYLVEYLNSDFGRQQVMAYASRGVSQSNISASNLLKVLIPLPPLAHQQLVCDSVCAHKSARATLKGRMESARLISRLIWGIDAL
jgi:restriction endonuclease S subunit